MSDAVYKINLRSGDMELKFQKAIENIFVKRTAEQIIKRITTVIDREVGKVFYYTAVDIFQNSFGDIAPYLGKPWRQYSPDYARRKQRRVGHQDWFKFGGYSAARAGEKQLGDELFGISGREVLQQVGKTQVSINQTRKVIRISIAPYLRFSRANMERQFSTLLSESAINKMQNRRRAYRALLGPEFMFLLNEHIPNVVNKSLRRL